MNVREINQAEADLEVSFDKFNWHPVVGCKSITARHRLLSFSSYG
jgi:hypothetical protein